MMINNYEAEDQHHDVTTFLEVLDADSANNAANNNTSRVYTSPPLSLSEVEEQSSRQIVGMLLERGKPDEDREAPFEVFRASSLGVQRSQITRLLDDLMPHVTKHPSPQYKQQFRDNLRLIIYGLAVACYRHEWMVLPMGDEHYRADARLGQLGFSRRRAQNILSALDEQGLLIRGRRGYLDRRNGEHKASQYFPSASLMQYFAGCLYEFQSEFNLSDGNLVRFNDFASVPALPLYADQVRALREYNEFMQQFSWAHKGPITRAYKVSMDRGGRLNTPYQNLPKRTVPVRPNTLLHGEPIVEPDFSCNQLRMAAAMIGEELPADPYSTIADQVGCDRATVKTFLTAALGAIVPKQIGGQMFRLLKDVDMDAQLYNALRYAFVTEYPWIGSQKVFYNDTGARMQRYEGEIAMIVCAEAVKVGLPVIPVHDAYATQAQHGNFVVTLMQEAWSSVLKTTICVPVK